MKRTTILADEGLLIDAKWLARQQSKTFTALVQEALQEYIAAHWPKRKISIIGIGRSAGPWTADSLNQELIEGLDPVEGWSPDRSRTR